MSHLSQETLLSSRAGNPLLTGTSKVYIITFMSGGGGGGCCAFHRLDLWFCIFIKKIRCIIMYMYSVYVWIDVRVHV